MQLARKNGKPTADPAVKVTAAALNSGALRARGVRLARCETGPAEKDDSSRSRLIESGTFRSLASR